MFGHPQLVDWFHVVFLFLLMLDSNHIAWSLIIIHRHHAVTKLAREDHPAVHTRHHDVAFSDLSRTSATQAPPPRGAINLDFCITPQQKN